MKIQAVEIRSDFAITERLDAAAAWAHLRKGFN
jgi:hypothetical protein